MSKGSRLISIIMPVYNAEDYVGEAISSVINQSYEDWELIIINDGSRDDSEKIIKSYQDDRIQYLKQANKGVSAARNSALKIMKGAYFCFLDADDVFTTTSLESRIEIFLRNKNVSFVDGEVYVTGKKIDDIQKRWRPVYTQVNPQRFLARIDDKIFVTISWMIKRNVDIDYRFVEGMSHAEDLWFFINYSTHGYYSSCGKPILYVRRTGESAMANLKGLETGYLQLFRLLRENVKNHNYTPSDLIYTRSKLMKIMFLSFFSQKQYAKALCATLKFLGVK